IPARIFHLPGCEGDIVPGVGGKERSDLGDGDHGDSADQDTPADIMKCVQPCVIPEVPVKIGGECQGIAPTEQSEQCQSQQRSDFRRSKNVRSEEHTSELQSLAYLVCR